MAAPHADQAGPDTERKDGGSDHEGSGGGGGPRLGHGVGGGDGGAAPLRGPQRGGRPGLPPDYNRRIGPFGCPAHLKGYRPLEESKDPEGPSNPEERRGRLHPPRSQKQDRRAVFCGIGLGVSLLIITFLTLYFESPGTTGGGGDGELSRPRRAKGYKGGDQCLSRCGGVELSYTMGSKTVYQFDLCSVIPCGSHPASWNGYDVYLCDSLQGSPGGVTGNGANPGGNGWCSRWGNVLWMTGRDAGRYVTN